MTDRYEKLTREVRMTEKDLVTWLAKAMAYRGVGDPNALDVHGLPRWLWYVEDALRFVDTYGYEIFRQPSDG